jgi:hypothetical protein
MNTYLLGGDVLGAVAVPRGTGLDLDASIRALAVADPMTAQQGHHIAALAIAALNRRGGGGDLVRQLSNMDASITSSGFDPLPPGAAAILRDAALRAVDRPATSDVVGAAVREWDNHYTYEPGEVVYYSSRHWRAQRRVEPPFLPAIMSGQVPGESDVWLEVGAGSVYGGAVLGAGEGFEVVEPVDADYKVLDEGEGFEVVEPVDPGCDVLGDDPARGGFSGVEDWERSRSYPAGAVVRYWGSYYRAARPVAAPFFPWFGGGEVPDGGSGAWAEVPTSALIRDDAASVLGEIGELLGFIDIQASQRQMDGLKAITVGVARALLDGGQRAIAGAIAGAKQPWYKPDLPGDAARKNVEGHLKWHQDEIAKAGANEIAPYPPGPDLKNYVMRAFVEANAVEEGAAYLSAAWVAMWAEIATELAKIPAEVRQAIADAANYVVQSVTGLPLWAWSLIIAGGVGVVGYGAYRVLAGPAGGAVARHYLPWR